MRARFGAGVAAVVLIAVGFAAPPASAADGDGPPAEITAMSPAVGSPAGGELVTVTGHGFVDGDTWVRVGADFVDVEVLSTTTLTFVAPPGAVGHSDVRIVRGDFEGPVWSYEYLAPPELIESPTATPSADEDGDQSVDPAPRPRRGAEPSPRDPDRGLDHGSRIPPELAATGTTGVATAGLGLAALLLGSLLVLLSRERRWGRSSTS